MGLRPSVDHYVGQNIDKKRGHMAADLVPESIDRIRAVGQIINDVKWPAVLVFFIYVARDGVSAFIRRLVNLDFSFGKARGILKAEPEVEQHSARPSAISQEDVPKELPEPQMDAEMRSLSTTLRH